MNKDTNPNANMIGVANLIDLPHIVANHEKIFVPVDTAIIIVAAASILLPSFQKFLFSD